MSKRQTNLRIGLVARADNSGLGVMSYDFYQHLPISKVMVITASYENFPERYPNALVCQRGIPTLPEINEFLNDLDLVIAIETPYNWNIFSKAKERGIKTILIPMYEWMPNDKNLTAHPDLYLCPSKVDYDFINFENKKLLLTPVDREKLPFIRRKKPETFVFINGHGGYNGRNGLAEFLQALPHIESDIKIIIKSQVMFDSVNDSRVEVHLGDSDYKEVWKDGDVYIHLHKFDGLSLPLNEAMSRGLPTIAPNIPPMNDFIPEELLFEVEGHAKMSLAGWTRPIDIAVISPIKVAQKIDEVAKMSPDRFENLSVYFDNIAQERSWEALYDRYIDTFEELCKSNII